MKTRVAILLLSCCSCSAFAQDKAALVPSATAQAPQVPPAGTSQNAPKPDAKAPNDEIVSHDSPTTFKVRVNLVTVRVVVRDSKGKVIPNLKRESFQLFDNGKPQVISSFSIETPASQTSTAKVETDSTAAPVEGTPVKPRELPQRFITLFFDDLHLSVKDVLPSKQAATKLFAAMQSGDRLSIFTTSGAVQQEFTADRDKLEAVLQRIVPHALQSHSGTDCPPMTLYEAYQIIEFNDPIALQLATADVVACTNMSMGTQGFAKAAAQRELNTGEAEIQFAYRNIDGLIRRMSGLPGQRIIVMMSPGYFVTPSTHESGDVIDQATKANIVINTIDPRGLYVSEIYDTSYTVPMDPVRAEFVRREEFLQQDVLAELADGTGGTFFHNRNDIDQGLLQAAAQPEVSYVLGFSPQNVKLDGKYHHLKVTFTNKEQWTLQARHGYFAPDARANTEVLAKEELQQAIFSQEEMSDMPIACRTEFFKSGNSVHLTVVVRVDTKGLRFRKADDRNKDDLTVATAVFDENGNLITGFEHILELRLKDETLQRLNRTGVNVRSSFDLQPGTFLVRIVVRDSEGAQMAAMSRGVVIP